MLNTQNFMNKKIRLILPKNVLVSNGNSYTFTYDISKDNNNYVVLQIKNLMIAQQLTIKIIVIPKTPL